MLMAGTTKAAARVKFTRLELDAGLGLGLGDEDNEEADGLLPLPTQAVVRTAFDLLLLLPGRCCAGLRALCTDAHFLLPAFFRIDLMKDFCMATSWTSK